MKPIKGPKASLTHATNPLASGYATDNSAVTIASGIDLEIQGSDS